MAMAIAAVAVEAPLETVPEVIVVPGELASIVCAEEILGDRVAKSLHRVHQGPIRAISFLLVGSEGVRSSTGLGFRPSLHG